MLNYDVKLNVNWCVQALLVVSQISIEKTVLMSFPIQLGYHTSLWMSPSHLDTDSEYCLIPVQWEDNFNANQTWQKIQTISFVRF